MGAAGAEGGGAGDGLTGFADAGFDGGEVVVAAAEGEGVGGEGGVGGAEEAEDLVGGQGDLVVEFGDGVRDGDAVGGGAGEGEVGVGGEAGAGAVGLPFVGEEGWVGVDVGELGGIGGAGVGGAIFEEGAAWALVVALRPETVKDEGEVLGALGVGGGVGMGEAELGGPGEVEKVVVEGLVAGC